MQKYLAAIDWKVLLFASVGCYVLPALFFGTLVSLAMGDGASEHGQWLAPMSLAAWLLLAPLAAGYLAARFARQLPQAHVALVGLIGAALCLVKLSAAPAVLCAFAVAVLSASAVGGFICLRSKAKREA
jgi:hypothetical protein